MPASDDRAGADPMKRVHCIVLGLALHVMAVGPAFAQGALATNDIVDKLRGAKSTVEINAPEIHQRAQERIKETLRAPAVNRAPVAEELSQLPQLAIDIQFSSDAAIIRPESYKTLGRIADALYHPQLLDTKFLVVGHTESTGKRDANLSLSQRRAGAIREALTTTFRISSQRVTALGLGEEQLQNRAKPADPANRRVQLIAVGKMPEREPPAPAAAAKKPGKKK